MKKVILFLILFIAINISVVKADPKYVGTCYCFNQNTVSTEKFNCSSYTIPDTPQDLEDVGETACNIICKKNGNGFYWYGTSLSSVQTAIDNCVACDKRNETTKKDCVYDDGNKDHPEDSKVQCKYDYSKAACESLSNGKWNEDTKCCDLQKVCWLHNEGGARMDGGTLYYQETSPCDNSENKSKYPNQVCQVTDVEASKCSGSSSAGKVEEQEQKQKEESGNHDGPTTPDIDINRKHMNCKELLGTNLTAIVKAFITILQVAAAIIAIVKGMIILIPAVIAKDADSLKKQSSTLVKMAVILLIVFLLPVFVKVIGHMLDFDLSCFV